MSQATSRQLRNVIRRFHTQVSNYRIHRYEVFKRRAFDHDLMPTVFSPIGKRELDFYECRPHQGTQSVCAPARCVVNLSGKKRYQEAFRMIDESLSVSNRRIPSIRNSHATILFSANIDQTDVDGVVRRTLRQSMEMIERVLSRRPVGRRITRRLLRIRHLDTTESLTETSRVGPIWRLHQAMAWRGTN